MSNTNLTHLGFANILFKKKNYTKAKWYYLQSIKEVPILKTSLDINLSYINKKINTPTCFLYDIIIPIFNTLEFLKRCIASLKENTNNARIILINDASNEETTLYLRSLALNDNNFYLVENLYNIGYTKSINRGLKLSSSSYVITLNSDTLVNKNWLKNMFSLFQSANKIGIVGPLSNAATWQTIPTLRDSDGNFLVNDLPKGLSIEELSSMVMKVSLKLFPKVELINGFCMMIRREVIDAIGYMDEEYFPLGYGEETDYCIRAKAAGFDLVIADNVYVYHAKSKSFGNKKRKELSTRGEEAIKHKHGVSKYKEIKNKMNTNQQLINIRSNIEIEIRNSRVR